MGPFLLTIWRMVVDVFQFWQRRLVAWYYRRSPVELWLAILRHAECFEEWEEAALHLDNLLGLDLWRNNPTSQYYDYRLIHERLASIVAAREQRRGRPGFEEGGNANANAIANGNGNTTARVGDDGDQQNVQQLVNLLRSGLVRNMGNITAPKLYNRSFAGTKFLIEEYITQVAEAIEDIASLPTAAPAPFGAHFSLPQYGNVTAPGGGRGPNGNGGGGGGGGGGTHGPGAALSTQMKLDFVHDTRQAFGRSTLVLQGGAIFGLCHLGVVKALFLRGLLPRIITGTATGALIAALVAIHTEEELPGVLKGDGIDLSAFAGKSKLQAGGDSGQDQPLQTRWDTLWRRIQRFRREGYFLDVKVLEDCVRANVGDLTFEEAYQRSKRILNITVAPAGQGGVPTLLNYLTAPNVLIWTAAVASNASTASLYGHKETTLLCKDNHGHIVPWKPANTVDFRHWTHVSYSDRESPLMRIAELFNVNHFIVSQARPYLIPFLQSDLPGPSALETRNKAASATAFLVRMVGLELRHRLRQLDTLRLLPAGIRRFLVDERVPGASVALVPAVTAADFVRLLETPTQPTLEYWIRKGERSVWPAVAALKIRCAVETELDRAYQQARRLKPGGLRRKSSSTARVSAPAVPAPEYWGREGGRDREKGKGKGKETHGDGGSKESTERDRAYSTGTRLQ